MKTFLYILKSVRNGAKDRVMVIGGANYHHEQLLLAIDAEDADHAARTLKTKVIDSFDRSSVNRPTVYNTAGGRSHSAKSKRGEAPFSFSLKEPEDGDEKKFSDLKTRLFYRIIASPIRAARKVVNKKAKAEAKIKVRPRSKR